MVRKPESVSMGPWEVSRVVQPPGLSHESRLSQMKPGALTEIRGGLDQISGFITRCPKFLLAEGEMLTYPAAFRPGKIHFPTCIPLKASAGQTFFFLSAPPLQWVQLEKCQVSGEGRGRWVCKNYFLSTTKSSWRFSFILS